MLLTDLPNLNKKENLLLIISFLHYFSLFLFKKIKRDKCFKEFLCGNMIQLWSVQRIFPKLNSFNQKGDKLQIFHVH